MGDEKIMQAARPRKTKLIGGFQDGGRVAQQFTRVVKGDGLQEGLGAEARPAREQALQVGGAEARLIGQGFQ